MTVAVIKYTRLGRELVEIVIGKRPLDLSPPILDAVAH